MNSLFLTITPESIQAVERIIEKFGFPIFVALCGLLLFAAVFRYMTTSLDKKDAGFMDYIKQRDQQIDILIEKHTIAYRENTLAIHKMRHSIENRMHLVSEQNEVLTEVKNTLIHQTDQ